MLQACSYCGIPWSGITCAHGLFCSGAYKSISVLAFVSRSRFKLEYLHQHSSDWKFWMQMLLLRGITWICQYWWSNVEKQEFKDCLFIFFCKSLCRYCNSANLFSFISYHIHFAALPDIISYLNTAYTSVDGYAIALNLARSTICFVMLFFGVCFADLNLLILSSSRLCCPIICITTVLKTLCFMGHKLLRLTRLQFKTQPETLPRLGCRDFVEQAEHCLSYQCNINKPAFNSEIIQAS